MTVNYRRFLLAIVACSCYGAQSAHLVNGITGSVTFPSTGSYATLNSYHFDLMVSGYVAGQVAAKQFIEGPASAALGNLSINAGFSRQLNVTPYDSTSGGSPAIVNAPNISITSISATNPAVLTLAATPYRLTMAVGQTVTFTNLAGTGCTTLNATTQTVTAVDRVNNTLTVSWDATGCTYTASSGYVLPTTLLIRVQRNATLNQWEIETWDAGGEGYAVGTKTISISQPISTRKLFVGGVPSGYSVDLAFFRWYSGTIALASTPPHGASGGDLGDWEFENSPNDSSVNGLNLANFSPSYPATPTFAPACNPGAQATFRAGSTATLDASQSYPLDGGSSLSYYWQQIASTATGISRQQARWSSHTIVNPTVTGLVFGPFNLQLTVTQGNGQSSTCTVNDGAVAMDANGAVVADTGNATFNSAITTLLGPMVAWGKNSFPWYDSVAQTAAAVQIANLDTVYGDYWDTAASGTISVTAGSAVVTGTGTHFLTDFCDGTGTPLSSSPAMVIWYPLNDGTGRTGRRIMPSSGPYVASCKAVDGTTPSYTRLTMTANWGSDVADCTSLGGQCQYSIFFGNAKPALNAWHFGDAPADYYDGVAAYYALYFRSGIDTYLIAARKLADRFWSSPEVDYGNSMDGATVLQWPPLFRCYAMMGMVLRALDTGDGHPDMWAGLHHVWDHTIHVFEVNYPDPNRTYVDAREYGYGLAQLNYCAMFDTSSTYRTNCTATIADTFMTSGTGYLNVWPSALDSVTHGFLLLSGTTSRNSWHTNSTVTLTNGSTSVACNGSCAFVNTDNAFTQTNGAGHAVWFTNTAANVQPHSNADGDADIYCYWPGQTSYCTYVDSTHFTLDRPYSEPGCDSGCTKGWAFDDAAGAVGFMQNPYMEGILGWAFDLSGQSLAASYPTLSALAYQYNTYAIQWMMAYGYRQATYGMYYLSGGPGCSLNIQSGTTRWIDANTYCIGGGTLPAREYGSDGFRGLMDYYRRTGDSAAKTIIDNLYGCLWAKPGTGAVYSCPDQATAYDTNFDAGGSWINSGYMPNKLWGQNFGLSRQDNWPVARIGGAIAPSTISVKVAAPFSDVPGATGYKVIVTEPTGIVDAPVSCSTVVCTVSINKTAGNYLLQIKYTNGSGTVIAAGQSFTAAVN